MDDVELLRQYLCDRSQSAFARLVERYKDMVYSAALRQTRDPGTAEDVAQAVFVCLARKAHTIRAGTVLSAWMMTATRNFSANARKMQARRRRHEANAARPVQEGPGGAEDSLWGQMEPVVDEAISRLGEGRRRALLLRYFDG